MSDGIQTPRGEIIETKNGTARLTWNPNFKDIHQGHYTKAQKFVDSEVLRLSSPFVPFRTGILDKSSKLGTFIGSGEVRWIAPYSPTQYYNTATSRPYDSKRGAFWFERMKAIYKNQIVNGAKKIAGGG